MLFVLYEILQGGVAGAERLAKSRILKRLLREQKEAGRMYGGICSSPAILHKQGLLKVTICKTMNIKILH